MTTGLNRGNKAAPEAVPADAECIWPLHTVLRTRTLLLLSDLKEASRYLPLARKRYRITQAVAMPIVNMDTAPGGILIVGLNPLRTFDDAYRHFLELVSSAVSAAITNGQAYEAERRRAEVLAEVDRAKTEFFSNVSHEFRTPLTLMLGPIEQALANANGSKQSGAATIMREELKLVHRNALRLLKLVNTLLDFAQIEAKRMEPMYEPTALDTYTAELASGFHSAIESAGLKLIVDCPPLFEPVYVDREMWEKIVLNLLANAFKFTFQGHIKVGLHSHAELIELTVADTGVGIPDAEQSHIFERFYRAPSMRVRTFEGTGIGLSLVKELVRLHGGEVTFESHAGSGTTFFISIPRGMRHLPREHIGTERRANPVSSDGAAFLEEALRWSVSSQESSGLEGDRRSPHAKSPTPHVLVADDNADMRQYIARVLADCYQVKTVTDGVAALQAARIAAPDLVLADIMMPLLDGFGLLQALRNDAQLADVPVVLLSARAGEEATVEGIKAGADDYLVKPFGARELLARVGVQLRRRKAEEALRRSEERFRRYFELGLIGMALTSPTKAFVEVNDEICNILGYKRHDLLGQSWAELTHPDDLLSEIANFGRVLAGQVDGYSMEKRWIRMNGDIVYTTISVKVLRLANGPVDCFLELLQDITERKKADLALSQARDELEQRVLERTRQLVLANDELRLEMTERKRAETLIRQQANLLDLTYDAVIVRNLKGEIGYWNRGAAEMYGWTAGDAIGKTSHSLLRTRFSRPLREVEDEVLTKGRWDGELTQARADGRDIEVNGRWVLQGDEQGTPSGILEINTDITERKRAERELRRREAYLAQAQALSHTGSWALNIENRELFWSDEHFRILGLDPAPTALTYPHALQVIHPDDRDQTQRALERAIREGTHFETDCKIVRPDSTVRYIHSLAEPVFSKDGELTELVGTIIDNTERKQAEDTLQKARLELAHMARITTMGELAASIAHEVNQPLSAVIADAGACLLWLQRSPPDIIEGVAATERIMEQIIRASEVLSRIRSLIKKGPPQSLVVYMNDLVTDVLSLTRYEVLTHSITLRTDLSTDVLPVRGDPVQLKQVLANLVINAIEAMHANPEGTRHLLIASRNDPPDRIVVNVRDSGPGLDRNLIEELFKPFVTNKPDGLGMGLTISRSLIEAHGGRLWASVNEDTGATFQFSLPALNLG